MTGLYEELAAAYVRGMLSAAGDSRSAVQLLDAGRAAGLKLHRFKRTAALPRVRAVLGILRGIAPSSLLDIGTGRGVFLWALLDAFPGLAVTAMERDGRRLEHLKAVRRGGIERLDAIGGDAAGLAFPDRAFDAVTVLEVLEHQQDPAPVAREAMRVAKRFVIASVPSKPDNNPEHVQLFSGGTLKTLLLRAGAKTVTLDGVRGHIIAVARKAEP